MSTNIEMEDLTTKRKGKEPEISPDDVSDHNDEVIDNAVAFWAWMTASLLCIYALPLLLFPRLLVFLATPGSDYDIDRNTDILSPLIRFLSFQFGMFLVCISLTLILYIPSPAPIVAIAQRRRDSFGHPLLGPVTAFSLTSSIISYNTKSVGSLGFVVFLGTLVIGLWGMWVIMFEGSSRISKKTGADKRTSAFLFHNKAAASSQKKEWKRERAQKL